MCVSIDDAAFMEAKKNLKLAYLKAYTNRRRTMFLDKATALKLVKDKQKPDPKEIVPTKIVKQKEEVLICKAVNMNGEKCKAKAKCNGVCGRHKLK
jgi:hypothetical protein